MIPLVATVRELRDGARTRPPRSLVDEAERQGVELGATVGTMIELPRAALTAGEIAEAAEFFSFGTNDLTQTTWGFSRDDVEGAFFSRYLERGIFEVSPFETIDRDGRGPAGPDRLRRGPGGAAGPGAGRLRRARRRPRVGALLPRGRARLRVVLAVPGAGRSPGGGPCRGRGRGRRGYHLMHWHPRTRGLRTPGPAGRERRRLTRANAALALSG